MKPREKSDLLYELAKVFYPIFFKSHDEAYSLPPIDSTSYFGKKYTRSWFLKEVFIFTKTNDIQQAIEKLIDFGKLDDIELEKITSNQEVQSSVPQNREELERIAEERQKQRVESQKKAKKDVREEIERKKQRFEKYSKQINKTERIYLNSEEEIKLPNLSKKAKENLDYLVSLAKEDPVNFNNKLQETIISEINKTGVFKNQEELIDVNSKQIALNFTDKLVGISESNIEPAENIAYLYTQNPIHQTSSLADPNNSNFAKTITDEPARMQISRSAQEISLALENDYSLAKTYLSSIVDKEILSYLYPTNNEILTFNVSQKITPKTISSIDQQQFAAEHQNIFEKNNQFTGFVKDQAVGEIKSQSLKAFKSSISKTQWYQTTRSTILEKTPILAGKEIQMAGSFFHFQPGLISLWNSQNIPILASNITGFLNLGSSNVLVTPIFNFNIGSFAVNRGVFTTVQGLAGQAFGINLGNFGITFTKVATETGLKFAINIATESATQILTQAGAQVTATAVTESAVAATTTVTTATTFLSGLPGGPIGLIISAIAGFLVGLVPKISKFVNAHKETFIALVSIPLLIFKVPAFIALSPAVVATIMALGKTTGGLAATIGGTIALISVGIISFIKQFLIYFSISVVGTGLLTAFIIFIINSGAYITPPSTIASTIENPYIDIKKTILPEGSSVKKFENSDIPINVEYKVTIKPKKSTMTNIKVSYKCQVIKKNLSPSCPKIEGNIPSNINETLSLGDEYSFTYKHNFSNNVYEDTLTIDTITITADILGFENNVEAPASASVVIGNPPDECPNNAWPIAGNVGLHSVTQGPFANGCSHENMRAEAIDIGVNEETVIAVHSGEAKVGTDDCYGKYVDIQSTCGNTVFVSRYAHLGIISIRNGPVSVGQTIGISDNTGRCTSGYHLHFDFRSPTGGKVNPPTMGKPYLIRDIPTGCCSLSTCNVGY